METGNKPPSISSLIKQEFHFKPDNEAELNTSQLRSVVDISRNRIQILKTSDSLKAVEMISFKFPYCVDDERWIHFLEVFINSGEYRNLVKDTEISHSISDPQVAVVPKSLFSDEYKEGLFNFTDASKQIRCIVKQDLEQLDAIGQFAIPKKLKAILDSSVTNSYLTWLNKITATPKSVYVNLLIWQNRFALVVSKEGKLLFSNWFSSSKAEDVLYFLMATLEGLNILHTEVSVVLNGQVEKNNDLHLLLGKYISKLSFATLPTTLKYSYSFKELPTHRYPLVFHAACA